MGHVARPKREELGVWVDGIASDERDRSPTGERAHDG